MSVVSRALSVTRAKGELLAIVGPTASGKTELAIALAEQLGGEIVSADSVQIYRGFDIGSGKPTAQELARAPHHLLGALDPLDPIDAATWGNLASRAILDVRARGRTPIVCGGTFLWVKSLLFGLAAAPAANAEVRAKHREIAESEGRPALHARLGVVDVESASRLHPNDFVRVSRALEVYELSGKTMSAYQREHAFAQVRQPAKLLAIARDPADLTERIRTRVAQWIARGWIDEVQALLSRGYRDARAMSSVGYEQIHAMLEGRMQRDELETAIVRATRVFARRQRTWLSHADVEWL